MLGTGRSRTAWTAIALAALLATAAFAPTATGKKSPKRGPSLEFRGQVIVPTGTTFQGTQVGGLSGIAHAGGGTFYTLSDDQANARFYKLHAAIADGQLSAGDITFQSVTTLKQPDGTPYPTASLDPEGFALTKHNRHAVVTSEGFATRLINPWIRVYNLDGSYVRDLPVPEDFNPNAAGTRGVRQNLGFESAATRGKNLFTGTEAALVQDGPPATITAGSPARILRYDLKRNTLERQWTYLTDPIAEPPVPATQFAVNGLVEILPLGKKRLITMERSFSVGAPGTGNTIKLYLVDLRKAGSGPVSKTLLLDLKVLGIPLDNVEGMAFGPKLRGGKRTLLLVSDNNFSAAAFTQFLLFAVSHEKKWVAADASKALGYVAVTAGEVAIGRTAEQVVRALGGKAGWTVDKDEDVRLRCFLALDALRARHGNDLPYVGALDAGFNYGGQRVPFLNRQKGIYKAAAQRGPAALAIQTSFKAPYPDEETEEGLQYAYRAGDVDQSDNRALRQAFVLGVPLVYFSATRPGWYRAEYPVYVQADNPAAQHVVLAPGRIVGPVEEPEVVPIQSAVERAYAVRETRVRLHQGRFRAIVLQAYRDRCTICRLRELRLLDAAHIVQDVNPKGLAEIPNGLSLCSIHHRAYDQDLVGVSPDYEVHVASRLVEEEDGPMLDVLKEANGRSIELPTKRTWHPDRTRLAERFERFLTA